MLKMKLLHPEILAELGRNGHGAKVLIADGNFPISTCTPSTTKKVFLNLAPGLLTVLDVLKVLNDIIPIEKATVMRPTDEEPQSVHKEFSEVIGDAVPLTSLSRFEFYELTQSNDVCLAIATGETRRFANLLLQIGVVKPVPVFEAILK